LAEGSPPSIARAIKDLETITGKTPTALGYFHLAEAYARAARQSDAAVAWRRSVALGLNSEQLHPLERPAFDRLRQELN
jgi:hypothetical protein